MHLNMSSGKRRPFCLRLNVLIEIRSISTHQTKMWWTQSGTLGTRSSATPILTYYLCALHQVCSCILMLHHESSPPWSYKPIIIGIIPGPSTQGSAHFVFSPVTWSLGTCRQEQWYLTLFLLILYNLSQYLCTLFELCVLLFGDFTHILQGGFTDTEAIIALSPHQWYHHWSNNTSQQTAENLRCNQR